MNKKIYSIFVAISCAVACSGPPTNVRKPPVLELDSGRASVAEDKMEASASQVDAHSGATSLEEDASPIDIDKTFDAAAFVERQEEIIAAEMDKPVFVLWNPSPREAARQLMEKLAPRLRPDLKVLIKPNLGGFTWFSNGPDNGMYGRTTDTGFIEGIVDYLEAHGVVQISIGESWGVDRKKDVQKLFRVSGLADLAGRHDSVTLVDMNSYDQDDPAPLAIPLPDAKLLGDELTLPLVYVDHLVNGLVINVPKLKTHRFAVVTAGMKNLMGVLGLRGHGLPHKAKWRMHREVAAFKKRKSKTYDDETRLLYQKALDAFSTRLVDAYAALHPHLTLIDGVVACEGDGMDDTSAIPMGVAIGSYNTVYADVVASRLIGFWQNNRLRGPLNVQTPPYISKALDLYFGGESFAKDIEVRGQPNILERDLEFRMNALAPFELKGTALAEFQGDGIVRARYLGSKRSNLAEVMGHWNYESTNWIATDYKGQGVPPGIATAFGVGFTDSELVVVFRSQYRTLDAVKETSRAGDVKDLFKGDVVEIFVDPDPSTTKSYYEFELSPSGERLDLSVDLERKSFDHAYESGMRTSTVVDETAQSWTAVIAIPFKAPHLPKPKSGDAWSGNFFRIEGKGRHRLYMAWSPTHSAKPRFHTPERFGKIVFD